MAVVNKQPETFERARKAVVIGCGFVGSTCAFALMESGVFSEIALVDAHANKAEGEALDIAHGTPFYGPVEVYAGSYADLNTADICIITAGSAQKPGESRLDLVARNVAILRSILHDINQTSFDGILILVSNPVDILTYVAARETGLPAHRVFGTGTILDSARFKSILSSYLDIDPRNVHARIIGEHGDSEFAVWSMANVSGIPLMECFKNKNINNPFQLMTDIEERVRKSAGIIIEKKGATYYGIAASVRRLCEAIMRDEKAVMTVSTMLDGEYGLSDVALSIVSVMGINGIEEHLPAPISEEELAKLRASAQTLKDVIAQVS